MKEREQNTITGESSFDFLEYHRGNRASNVIIGGVKPSIKRHSIDYKRVFASFNSNDIKSNEKIIIFNGMGPDIISIAYENKRKRGNIRRKATDINGKLFKMNFISTCLRLILKSFLLKTRSILLESQFIYLITGNIPL